MLASKISYIRSKLNEIEPAKNESVKKSGLILGAPTKAKGGYSMSTLKGMKEKQAGVRHMNMIILIQCAECLRFSKE